MTQVNNIKSLTPKKAAACCAPIDDLLDAELFKALGDATRVRLLGCLAKCRRQCTVTEIADCCTVDFSVVSRHLQLLDRAGIVKSARQGRSVTYQVNYSQLSTQLHRLADAFESYDPDPKKRKSAKQKANCCE